MADFDSFLGNPDHLSKPLLKAILDDDLTCKPFNSTVSSLWSYTPATDSSASEVISGAQISIPVTGDEVVILISSTDLSSDDDTNNWEIAHSGTNGLGTGQGSKYQAPIESVGGNVITLTTISYWYGFDSGNHTFSTIWRRISSGSGTVYSAQRSIHAFKFKAKFL